MDARRTPQRIVNAHPPDQRAQVRVDLGPASKGAGFPTPVMAKAGPMPTHQGLRSDDSDGPEHRWKPSIQQDQEQAIPICEPDATSHLALQHNQLMTERRVLGPKSALRLERRDGKRKPTGHPDRQCCMRTYDPTKGINQWQEWPTPSGSTNNDEPARCHAGRRCARPRV